MRETKSVIDKKKFERMKKKSKLTFQQIAQMAGLSLHAVYRISTAYNNPNLDTVVKITDVLGCTVDDILLERKVEE